MSVPHTLLASFNGRRAIAVDCGTEWLAAELRRRMLHLVAASGHPPSVILRVTLNELEVSWIEVRDSTGRCEGGSFEYAVYHARKWMTAAFVEAHPELVWLHAAAASMNGVAVVLAGPAGAGKSTLLTHLIKGGWDLLADDAVALRPDRREALPLPFSPEVRRAECDQAEPAFLAQPKTLVTVAPNRVATEPAVVTAIVFPEYAPNAGRPIITPLTVVSAAQALATQVLGERQGGRNIVELFRLAGQVPCYRLRYRDSVVAARELTTPGRLQEQSGTRAARHHRRAVSLPLPDAKSVTSQNVNPRRRANPES